MDNDLWQALVDLNEATLDVIRVGNDTIKYPMLNRQRLREIASLVEEMLANPMVE